MRGAHLSLLYRESQPRNYHSGDHEFAGMHAMNTAAHHEFDLPHFFRQARWSRSIVGCLAAGNRLFAFLANLLPFETHCLTPCVQF